MLSIGSINVRKGRRVYIFLCNKHLVLLTKMRSQSKGGAMGQREHLQCSQMRISVWQEAAYLQAMFPKRMSIFSVFPVPARNNPAIMHVCTCIHAHTSFRNKFNLVPCLQGFLSHLSHFLKVVSFLFLEQSGQFDFNLQHQRTAHTTYYSIT